MDLLYPAPNFDQLDQWLTTNEALSVIQAKQFSHKCAFLCEQIMIEVLLLQQQEESFVTRFFDSRYQLVWPHDTLSLLSIAGQPLPVASRRALQLYRQEHQHMAEAYRAYFHQQRKS